MHDPKGCLRPLGSLVYAPVAIAGAIASQYAFHKPLYRLRVGKERSEAARSQSDAFVGEFSDYLSEIGLSGLSVLQLDRRQARIMTTLAYAKKMYLEVRRHSGTFQPAVGSLLMEKPRGAVVNEFLEGQGCQSSFFIMQYNVAAMFPRSLLCLHMDLPQVLAPAQTKILSDPIQFLFTRREVQDEHDLDHILGTAYSRRHNFKLELQGNRLNSSAKDGNQTHEVQYHYLGSFEGSETQQEYHVYGANLGRRTSRDRKHAGSGVWRLGFDLS